MERPELHLCIATGQNLANLIPALQCAAREVWILQTPAMHTSAAHLASALKARGVETTRINFADEQVTALHAQAEAVAERLGRRLVAINITGGTKLMTLALTETLELALATGEGSLPPHLVYTDTVRGRLDWLRPAARSEPMQDILRINDVLLAQGYRRQDGTGGAEDAHWLRAAGERRAVTAFMGQHSRTLGRFFGTLNGLAHRALDAAGRLRESAQHFEFAPGGKAAELLRIARDAGLVAWNGDTSLSFLSSDSASYLGGGWVEEYAGLKISGARPSEWAPRLRVKNIDTGSMNELDAVVVHRNRVLVVECKAARVDGGSTSEWIYKASQLARSVGGVLAKALLVSAREFGDADRQRATEYGVDVLCAGDLAGLSDYLRRWMAS
ncbi:MAG: DUF1887 family CARF protein [Burkholderiales bacterium]|nr:DUF1887 family CARF protein [Burkholderiales bacterium]